MVEIGGPERRDILIRTSEGGTQVAGAELAIYRILGGRLRQAYRTMEKQESSNERGDTTRIERRISWTSLAAGKAAMRRARMVERASVLAG